MKRAGVMLTAMIMAMVLFTSILLAKPSFIPRGARWWIDKHRGHPGETGHWSEVANFGTWGQGQCQPSGTECHLWDWVTWSQDATMTFEPREGEEWDGWFNGEDTDTFPESYDASSGEYVR